MKKAKVSLICALAKDRAIGYKNQLLWQIPADLAHFKKITTSHPVIMGQKTFESIGRPLPNRTNIIVSKDESLNIDGCIIAHSIDEALDLGAKKDENKISDEINEIFIIGGGSVYAQTIDIADKLYLTLVEGKYKADTYFPEYQNFKKIIKKEKGESSGYKYQFLEL